MVRSERALMETSAEAESSEVVSCLVRQTGARWISLGIALTILTVGSDYNVEAVIARLEMERELSTVFDAGGGRRGLEAKSMTTSRWASAKLQQLGLGLDSWHSNPGRAARTVTLTRFGYFLNDWLSGFTFTISQVVTQSFRARRRNNTADWSFFLSHSVGYLLLIRGWRPRGLLIEPGLWSKSHLVLQSLDNG